MVLSHIGIVNENEEEAVRFYADFLGLEKTREFLVDTGLSGQIFSVSREIKVLVFERQGIKVEVFICPECRPHSPDFRHIGLLIEDFSGILEKARRSGVKVIEGGRERRPFISSKIFPGT